MALDEREYMKPRSGSFHFEWPDAAVVLVSINVAVFVLQHMLGVFADETGPAGQRLWGALSLNALWEGRVWTLVTHLFVHLNIWHILFNCMMILMAGRWLLTLVGRNRFLYIYFASGIAGAFLQLAMEAIFGTHAYSMRLMGASASGMGVFVACAAMQPREEITALIYLIIPIRTRLWTMASVLMISSLVFGVLQLGGHGIERFLSGSSAPVAHFAHLGGALAGWYAARLLGYTGRVIHYDDLQRERRLRQREPAAAGARRRRRVVDLEDPDNMLVPPRTRQELIEREIDPILDKMSAHGEGSLTDEERRILKKASEELERLKR